MGACSSKVAQWREEAEEEWKAGKQQEHAAAPAQLPQPLPRLPQDAPASYVPPLPPPTHNANEEAEGMHRDGSVQFAFRKSQELSMAHLVRHPRLLSFQMGGQFGLDPLYTPVKLLGRGGTGATWLCQETSTGKQYALKMMQRPIPRNTVRLTYNEVCIQASTCVSSVHMSHIKEVMLTPTHLAMVLDYEAGGSVAEFVAQQIPKVSRLDLVVDEDHARFMFKQLIAGLEHLHDNHVAHRDIKLDNTLLDGQIPATVKLCDFQFSKYWGRPQLTRMKTHLGTAVYMAPELIENRQSRRPYNPVEVDVWAAGVWLVALIAGAFPYDNRPGADDTAAEMQILHQEMTVPWSESRFVRPYIQKLSPELVDLLNHVLHTDPELRADLEAINSHPWMRKPLPPHLEAALQRTRHAQMQLERRLAMLTPDHDLVHRRNSRVFDLVREASLPAEHWEESYHRLVQVCAGSPTLVDCSTLPGVVRIDMMPAAVAKRLSEKALSLLDGPLPADSNGSSGRRFARSASPPGTPKRFSLPLQTIDSNASLTSMVPGSGEGEPLRPLGQPGPSPLGLPAGQASAPSSSYARSHSGGGLTAGEGSMGGGSTASASHEELVSKLSPLAAPATVAATGR